MEMGYICNFIDGSIEIPLPKFSLELEAKILKKDELREGYIADYTHFSVVMNSGTKQAVFSASNLDQNLAKNDVGEREWWIDPRIGAENQLNGAVYKRNIWDRGHLTRRADVTWGDATTARRASKESCSYSNACPQHENFNQDEWLALEDWVFDLQLDTNGKITVFTGPIFTDSDRWLTPKDLNFSVRIPGAFWKIISFQDKESKKIKTIAFIMYQDEMLADKDGRKDSNFELMRYQISTTEIEEKTGLEFPEILIESNPLDKEVVIPVKSIHERFSYLELVTPRAIPIKNSTDLILKKNI